MEHAAFSLDNYFFDKVTIDLSKHTSDKMGIKFSPSGVFHIESKQFELVFSLAATSKGKAKMPFATVKCIAIFSFENVNTLEEIPSFFYRNSIAILYPFLRAYVSMMTSQANLPGLILPVLNLSSLENPLRENTIQK